MALVVSESQPTGRRDGQRETGARVLEQYGAGDRDPVVLVASLVDATASPPAIPLGLDDDDPACSVRVLPPPPSPARREQ